ncbi:nicotinate (nicotinamide) nucleotide adenylyltransferase [Alicyclobacillus sp. SO9]|uniref:nicotinate (nicotinamide) nucleotide adenylyltransferase n=1 Tax=Alicyclobacillus sp. SO9 TaxID=2665646 RepID=UPI0018E8A068|nr:nicotinate (nicotinamide) nucleotide adenylyltransferase [Alicyclobacillus sp. SO9]QQE77361.1 nicotinate (nicotinamide) nucleotide adenylyltransferase [Alicyclobacillus sp. SO9]
MLQKDCQSHVILFGGTFDPPHVGHLSMATLALEQSGADEVWFVPAWVPPHKDSTAVDYDVRVNMVKTLVADNENFVVSSVERDLPEPSYTVDTVQTFQHKKPNTYFEFLIGSDSLAALSTWERAAQLTQAIDFLVAVRQGFPFHETYAAARRELPHLRARALEMPILDVSSTWLRDRTEQGLSLCGLVPERVLEVWRRTQLSRKGETAGDDT